MKRLALILLCAISLSGCAGFLFYPQKPHVLSPETINLKFENVQLKTKDGVHLHGWFLPAKGRAKATILHFHGNAENISTHIGSVYWLPEQGFNVLLVDYRGYGLSGGRPTLDGVHLDAEAALTYLVNRADIPKNRIIIFGQSIGGAIAVYTVANSDYREHIKALVIESALSSYRGITREKLGNFWLTWPFQYPLSLTMSDNYSPLPVIDKISPIPLLIIHGDQDPIVPLIHGQRLFDVALEPKEMWVVNRAGHTQSMRYTKYRQRLVDYLHQLLRVKTIKTR